MLSEATGMSSGDPNPSNSWYIDVPTGKNLTVILKALDGTYPTANTQMIKKSTMLFTYFITNESRILFSIDSF